MAQAIRRVSFFCAALLAGAGIAAGQQTAVRPAAAPARIHSYVAARETILEGVFVRFEAAGSGRILLQTAGGTITADLGPREYLAASQFTLAAGDSIKLVGVSSTTRQGTAFLARVIQKGGEALALRTAQGAPLGRFGAARLGAREKREESAR
jgi:hypothetical protein